jgi:hypothetical protein
MHRILLAVPLMLSLNAVAFGQAAPDPAQNAQQAPAQVAPTEQAAPAGNNAPSQDQQTMQQQAPAQQGEALPAACAPVPGLSGSEQSMGTADMSGLEHLGEGNDQLISATSALQVQIKSAAAQENIDIAYACALVALYNGLEAITAVHAEFGQDPTIRQTAERVLSAGGRDIGGVIDWLNQQQPSQSPAQ